VWRSLSCKQSLEVGTFLRSTRENFAGCEEPSSFANPSGIIKEGELYHDTIMTLCMYTWCVTPGQVCTAPRHCTDFTRPSRASQHGRSKALMPPPTLHPPRLLPQAPQHTPDSGVLSSFSDAAKFATASADYPRLVQVSTQLLTVTQQAQRCRQHCLHACNSRARARRVISSPGAASAGAPASSHSTPSSSAGSAGSALGSAWQQTHVIQLSLSSSWLQRASL